MLPKERSREIRLEIRRILMAEWDPIGVNGIPEAADGYDSYIGELYELLVRGASISAIASHLQAIEIDRMGLVGVFGRPLIPPAGRNVAASSLRALAEAAFREAGYGGSF